MEYIQSCARKLCTATGVGGETQIIDAAKQLLEVYTDDIVVDTMGNIIATVHSEKADTPVLLLEAHMDEIGFVVTNILENGFLKVACCGGIDRRCVAATPVTVWGKEAITGVFCSIPPHLNKDKDNKAPSEQDLFIDVGLSAQEVKDNIALGTRVSFANNFANMQGDIITSKALDNRAGMVAILYALSLCKDKKLPYTVKVLFACGEELGCRGATTGTFAINPDVAIVTDVSFAHTADTAKENCGDMGKGAMLGVGPILSRALSDTMQEMATKRGIPYQIEVSSRITGTDADVISISRTGVPTMLLSVPLRYMHTPVETVDCKDIAAVGQCMAAFMEEGRTQ